MTLETYLPFDTWDILNSTKSIKLLLLAEGNQNTHIQVCSMHLFGDIHRPVSSSKDLGPGQVQIKAIKCYAEYFGLFRAILFLENKNWAHLMFVTVRSWKQIPPT